MLEANITDEEISEVATPLQDQPEASAKSQPVRPFLPEDLKVYISNLVAFHVENKTKTGYEINFTKYFFEFKPLRSLAEIKADILDLEESRLELEKKVLD